MNWRELLTLSRRQLLLVLPNKGDTAEAEAEKSDADESSPPDHGEFVANAKAATHAVLAAEHPLLYDHAGRPIPQGSELWRIAEPEWRRETYRIVDTLLDQIPAGKLPKSEEELKEAFTKALQDNPKPRYIFTPHDGKLTIPVSIQLGEVQIQGAIPLYKIAGAIMAGVGLSKLTQRTTVPSLAAGTARVNSKDGLEYVWIPPGDFMMGAVPGDAEAPPPSPAFSRAKTPYLSAPGAVVSPLVGVVRGHVRGEVIAVVAVVRAIMGDGIPPRIYETFQRDRLDGSELYGHGRR